MNDLASVIIRALLLSLHDPTYRIMTTHVLPRFPAQYEQWLLISLLI